MDETEKTDDTPLVSVTVSLPRWVRDRLDDAADRSRPPSNRSAIARMILEEHYQREDTDRDLNARLLR